MASDEVIYLKEQHQLPPLQLPITLHTLLNDEAWALDEYPRYSITTPPSMPVMISYDLEVLPQRGRGTLPGMVLISNTGEEVCARSQRQRAVIGQFEVTGREASFSTAIRLAVELGTDDTEVRPVLGCTCPMRQDRRFRFRDIGTPALRAVVGYMQYAAIYHGQEVIPGVTMPVPHFQIPRRHAVEVLTAAFFLGV